MSVTANFGDYRTLVQNLKMASQFSEDDFKEMKNCYYARVLMHDAARPDSTVPLDFVFAIYLRQFYHSVFPLSSPALLIRNVCYLLCTGAGCACISTYPGNSSSRGLGIVSLVVLAVFYTSGLTLEGIFFIALFTAIAVVLTLRHLNNGKARDDNEAMDC